MLFSECIGNVADRNGIWGSQGGIDNQCVLVPVHLLGSGCCVKCGGQRQLIGTEVHLAWSLANSVGFAGIK